MNASRYLPRPKVEYRNEQGATVWTDARAWTNLPVVGTVLLHEGKEYLVTGAWTFDTGRAPIVAIKEKSGSGLRRSIRFDDS